MLKVEQKRGKFKGLSHGRILFFLRITFFLALPRTTLVVKMLLPKHVLATTSFQTSKKRGLWSNVPAQVFQS